MLKFKYLYGGDLVYSESSRHDAVIFYHDNMQRPTIIERAICLDDQKSYGNDKLVLLRLVELVELDHDNFKVVEHFGLKGYSYRISKSGYVNCSLIRSVALLRSIVVIVDLY